MGKAKRREGYRDCIGKQLWRGKLAWSSAVFMMSTSYCSNISRGADYIVKDLVIGSRTMI